MFVLKFNLQPLFQSEHFSEKRKDPEPDRELDSDPYL
jgi:hypothetical protein